MRTSRRCGPQSGFSLLELMVAVALSLILISGVIAVYITGKKTYTLNNAVSAILKNGRSAIAAMEYPIRMAGFFGCAHGIVPQSILQSSAVQYTGANAITGYEYTGTGLGAVYTVSSEAPPGADSGASWTPALPQEIAAAVGIGTNTAGAAIPGSDIILLEEAAPGGIDLVAPYQDSDGLFVGPGRAAHLASNELAVVADCRSSGLFQITRVAANYQNGAHDRIDHSSSGAMHPGNVAPAQFTRPMGALGAGAKIYPYRTYLFYIGIGNDKNPALFEIDMGSNGLLTGAHEIAPGIENMQFIYGVDTDGDRIPNNFQTADTVRDWGQVVSVRVALLVRSDDDSADTSSTFTYAMLDPNNGTNIILPKDKRLRRVFQETFSLRNRLP